MKLKKIILAAFIIMAVTLVMTGCPMTAKDYKAAKAEEYQLQYDEGINRQIEFQVGNLVHRTLKPDFGTPKDITKKEIEDYLKVTNDREEKRELSLTEKHYGVKKRKIVYTGSDLKAENYKDKDTDEVVKEIMKLFKLQ